MDGWGVEDCWVDMVDLSEGAVLRNQGDFPRSFGNYLFLNRLAEGGMGEVFLAKSGALAGIEKYCVVKTLRPQLTHDREYITRFVDEARVAVHLGHRNICQIFDVGRVGDRYYLAMELVVGNDLRAIQQRAKELKIELEPALILHIMGDVLEALDYAHRHSDPVSGAPLSVVHRDVSPQNVMVNFEGEVKLIDFGLAKSNVKIETTQPHLVMGKMSYMAPEHARGDDVDGRADQFAAAVVAYELLSGERFYEGLSFEQMWGIAGRGGHKPQSWETLEPGLRPVIARALHRDPDQRYASCGDFADALSGYLLNRKERATTRQVRTLMERLFKEELAAHRDLLSRFANVRLMGRDQSEEDSKSFITSPPEFATQSSGADDDGFEESTIAEAVGGGGIDSDIVTAYEPTNVGPGPDLNPGGLAPPEDLLADAPPEPHDITVSEPPSDSAITESERSGTGEDDEGPSTADADDFDHEAPTGPAIISDEGEPMRAHQAAVPEFMAEDTAQAAVAFSESDPTIPDQSAATPVAPNWKGYAIALGALALLAIAAVVFFLLREGSGAKASQAWPHPAGPATAAAVSTGDALSRTS